VKAVRESDSAWAWARIPGARDALWSQAVIRQKEKLTVRRLMLGIVVLVASFVLGTSVAAAAPHFTHGGEPVCTITTSGGTASVSCPTELAGLGEGDLLIETTVSGFAVYTCQNQGGNQAPGQNRVLEGPTTTPVLIPGGSIKNGRAAFTALGSLSAADTVSGTAAGCPNPNWTGVNPQLTVTDITENISQAGVLLFTCSASNPEGLTSPVTLSCQPA